MHGEKIKKEKVKQKRKMMKKFIFFIGAVIIANTELQAKQVHEKLYNLDIANNEFQEIRLVGHNGARLPIETYPELGQHKAFRLIPSEGKSEGKPVDIVIQTETPSTRFIAELEEKLAQENNPKHKQRLEAMLKKAKKRKETDRGIHAIYRSENTPQGIRYKLYQLRTPGKKESGKEDDEAIIVATPTGNLQVFENSTTEPGKKDVIEFPTGTGN